MKTLFIDKTNKNNIKYNKNESFYPELDIKSFIYDDSRINYYSIKLVVGDSIVIPTTYFHEYDFDTKGDLVVAMVNLSLDGLLKFLKHKGLINGYELH